MEDARRRPAHPPSRTVLEEEEYESTLSHIVVRDYYPALPSLRRDAAILDARGRGDVSGAVAVRRRARIEEVEAERERDEIRRREEEEAAGVVAGGGGRGGERGTNDNSSRPLRHECVTGFHARVTSEDDAEFERNQERERKEREAFLGVVYAAKADGKRGRMLIESSRVGGGGGGVDYDDDDDGRRSRPARSSLWCDTPLGLSSDLYDPPPSAGLRITDGTTRAVVPRNNDGIIGRNGLFFQPMHRSLPTAGTAPPSSGGTFLALDNDEDHRLEANNAKYDNLLMPPPPARLAVASTSRSVPHRRSNDDGAAANLNATTTPAADSRRQLGEYYPPRGPSLPDIHPPATRFPYQNESRLLVPNINNGGGTGIVVPSVPGGVVRRSFSTDASDTTDLDESPRPLDAERAARRRACDRENETFVAMTPLILPGGQGNAASSSSFGSDEPIMTWGDVASTPLVLGGGCAIDGRVASSSSADWEPARPSSTSGFVGEPSTGPAFDVIDRSRREAMARRAEKGLSDRARAYRSAGSGGAAGRGKDDETVRSSRSRSALATPMNRTASLTPAARALLDASINRSHQSNGSGSTLSSSRIFASPSNLASSSAASGINAGSRDSFGSALRASYTPDATSWSKGGDRKRKAPSSSLRRASAGATPRCQSLR
ncbi:hypothetical protein ACHAW5_010070 [Stephanodiscus triporus]|uniref:Uncharacterized protein n=1 Tax=Stephanodiscus triporus TaxID=2934178 RepID=A0ABD3QFB2_9STRA